MKKLKLLLLITLLPVLSFGQATGKDFANYLTSGNIGTAATTVDVYSRININQTTPSITLTVPKPTNTSTKVVEVWIGNKGTVSFTLRALPDVDGFVLDTGQAVILKWIGLRYSIVGKGNAVDLSGYIKLDGSSPATTGTIEIGDGYGFQDTSSVYNSRFVTTGIDFFKTDPFYFGSRPLRFHAGSTDYRSTFSLADDGYIFNTLNNFSGNTSYNQINSNGFYFQNYTSGFTGSYFGLNTSGLYLQAQAGSGITRYANIRTSLYTGSGTWTYELPNKGGTFAMTTDTLPIDQTKIPYFSGGISGTTSSSTYLRGDGVWSTVSGGVASVTGTANRITSTGGSNPVIDIDAAYVGQSSITTLGTIGTGVWNAGAVTSSGAVTGLNFQATGSGGNGYLRLPFQTTAPTAVSGSMIIYSDGSNRFSIVRRNNANSADITRTHLYPDASYSWTFPTPASGSTSTLAGLETAQTFTQANTFSATNIFSVTQRFSGAGFTMNNGTSDVVAMSGSGTILQVGGGYTTVNLKSVNVAGSTMTSSLGTVLTLSTNNRSSAVNSDNVLVTTGTSNGAKTGDILISPSNASGGGTKGNVALLSTAAPAWNSGAGILHIADRATVPIANPSGGYYMWGESGNPTFRSSGGGITTLGTNGIESNAGLSLAYVAKTSTYTIALNDYLINCTTGTFTVTLPTAVGIAGKTFIVKNSGTGAITLGTTSSQTIDGTTTKVYNTQYSGVTVTSDGANWIVTGTF